MHLLFHDRRRTVNTDRGSKGIHIPDLMSHNNNLVLCRDELPQCLRLDSRLDSRILRYLLTLASKICDVICIFDNRLVASSCKRKIDRHTGIVVTLCICIGAHSKSDTECRRHLISNADPLDFLKQCKLVFLQLLEILFLDHDKIFILLHLLDNSVNLCNILVDLTVDQRHKE